MLGSAARVTCWVADYALPLTAVSVYRMIPDHARGELFSGPPASLQAVAAIRAARGSGWQIIKAAMSNHPKRAPLP